MTDITWKTAYEVGNLEIDAEHQVFVKIIQKIQQATANKRDMHYIDRLLLELLKYAEFHFCSEENIMFDVGYPELHQHERQHKQLLVELRGILPEAGNEKREMQGFIEFLMRWFTSHTITEDQKLADYVKQMD